jgi:pantothenate kinase-related protein Tda10
MGRELKKVIHQSVDEANASMSSNGHNQRHSTPFILGVCVSRASGKGTTGHAHDLALPHGYGEVYHSDTQWCGEWRMNRKLLKEIDG